MTERKGSMNMTELQAIHENRETSYHPTPPVAVDPNETVFREICRQVEQEDLVIDSASAKTRRGRRGSLSPQGGPFDAAAAVGGGGGRVGRGDAAAADSACDGRRRRHSSFESRSGGDFRRAHAAFQAAQAEFEDRHAVRRASFVRNMLDFNLSVEMNSIALMSQSNLATGGEEEEDGFLSPAMQFSCPVLSYMNDEEEDSVELRLLKEENEVVEDSLNWESLHDVTLVPTGTTAPDEASPREFVIEMPALPDDADLKPRRRTKRRKPHSYKVLEQQLNEHSPQHVLQNLNRYFSASASAVPRSAATPVHPMVLEAAGSSAAKSLEGDPKGSEQQSDRMRRAFLQHGSAAAPPAVRARPATARGA